MKKLQSFIEPFLIILIGYFIICYIVSKWSQKPRINLSTAIDLFGDSSRIDGYYYINVQIGIQKQYISLILDTGYYQVIFPCDLSCTNCSQIHYHSYYQISSFNE